MTRALWDKRKKLLLVLRRPPCLQVDVHHVMAVRSALLRADTNLWQPLDFNVKAIGNALGGGDDEVNRALEQLLVGGNRHEVGGV